MMTLMTDVGQYPYEAGTRSSYDSYHHHHHHRHHHHFYATTPDSAEYLQRYTNDRDDNPRATSADGSLASAESAGSGRCYHRDPLRYLLHQ